MDSFDLLNDLRGRNRYLRSDVDRVRQMCERFPDQAEFWEVLGTVMQICADHEYAVEESIVCYKEALRCDPQYASAHTLLGYAYDSYLDDFANAAEQFRLAIAKGAGDIARVGLARGLAQSHDTVGVLAQLDLCTNQVCCDVDELRREIREGVWIDGAQDVT